MKLQAYKYAIRYRDVNYDDANYRWRCGSCDDIDYLDFNNAELYDKERASKIANNMEASSVLYDVELVEVICSAEVL